MLYNQIAQNYFPQGRTSPEDARLALLSFNPSPMLPVAPPQHPSMFSMPHLQGASAPGQSAPGGGMFGGMSPQMMSGLGSFGNSLMGLFGGGAGSGALESGAGYANLLGGSSSAASALSSNGMSLADMFANGMTAM